MGNDNRDNRVRRLIKKLNKERKKQAQKIDILCNDLIAAQRDFLKRLTTISFTAHFYESIIALNDLNKILGTAAELIKEELVDTNVTFFLRDSETFKLHIFGCNQPAENKQKQLEDYFGPDLIENIFKSNKVCTTDDIFAFGFEVNQDNLKNISIVTIPLATTGPSLGFILLYRSLHSPLTIEEIRKISAVTRGLSQAIFSCRTPLRAAD